MNQKKDRQLLKTTELGGFRVLVLHHVSVLLLLTHSCGGQSLIDLSEPIVAMVGSDITLPCQLEPVTDVAALTVEWARPDLSPRFIYLKRDGAESLSEQNSQYTKRTSLTDSKLKCGDISLKLSLVKLSDAGTYKCLVPKFVTESAVELIVGSTSLPGIEISIVDTAVVLVCKSKGWYPEPEVLWLDAEGNLLSAGPTETVRGPDDLYTVSSRVTVKKKNSNTFICRVQQKNINQTRETEIYVPDDFFVDPSSSPVRITITLLVFFMCVLTCAFILWRVKTMMQTPDKDFELQHLMEEHREGQGVMTVKHLMKSLDKKKAKLDQESNRNKEDLEHVEEMIKVLTEEKNVLKTQRDKHNSLLQEVKMDIKENEKKEKPKLDKDKKLEKRQKLIEKLKKTNEEYEELLANTEKLVEETDKMIVKMTEKKAKLERDREQIDKTLKELEEQRDEVQRKLQSEPQMSETEEGKNDAKDNGGSG